MATPANTTLLPTQPSAVLSTDAGAPPWARPGHHRPGGPRRLSPL